MAEIPTEFSAGKMLVLMRELAQLQEDVEQLRAEVKEVTESLNILAVAQATEQERQKLEREKAELWRHAFEVQRFQEHQILTLRLELALARLGSALPEPPKNSGESIPAPRQEANRN